MSRLFSNLRKSAHELGLPSMRSGASLGFYAELLFMEAFGIQPPEKGQNRKQESKGCPHEEV